MKLYFVVGIFPEYLLISRKTLDVVGHTVGNAVLERNSLIISQLPIHLKVIGMCLDGLKYSETHSPDG